jgi:prepilin-type processing-associated H-X9-DG protein
VLPPLYNGPKTPRRGISFGLDMFSWQTMILPFIEEQAMYDRFDFGRLATDPLNQPAVNQQLRVGHCPTTPRNATVARGLWADRGKFNEQLTAATGDYASAEGYLDGLVDCIHGIWGQVDYGDSYLDTPRVIKIKFADIADGLTKTALVLERAGLPDRYFGDGRNVEPHDPPQFRTWGNVGLWAITAERLLNHLQDQAGVPIVNGDNLHGLYSFHPGGVHITFADGSVQFVAEAIPTETIFALITRDGGEVVSTTDLQ